MAQYFKRERKPVSIDEMADEYRARNMMAVIQNTTDETITGLTPVPNKHVADGVQRNSDVFMGFGVIDPWQQKVALQEIQRIKDLGLHGVGEIKPGPPAVLPQRHPLLSPVGGVPEARSADPVPQRHGRRRRRHPRRHGQQAQVHPAHSPRRRGRGLPRAEDHLRPPVVAVDRREPRHRPSQEQLLHRPVGLVAQSTSPPSWCSR